MLTLFHRLFVAMALCATGAVSAQGLAEARTLTVAEAGFAARYYAPPPGSAALAGVIMLGGSDGGYPSARAARDLAAAGHPVLALAYFGGFATPIDGLPARLERIPLEYTYAALDWLHAQLGRERPIALMGESRGAELALLIATRRRDVAGVVAFSPSSHAWPAVGDVTGSIPAWTEGGRAVPYVDLAVSAPATQFEAGLKDVERARDARIPIERSSAAILLISSRSDAIWPAARMADALASRLGTRQERRVVNLQFDDASHLLMGPGPGVVRFTQGDFTIDFGGSEAGTRRARDAAWSAAKAFLAGLGTPP